MMLQVRFAEVNRRALTELGANFVVNRPDYAGRVDDAAVRGARPSTTRAAGRTGLQRFPEPVLLQSPGRLGRDRQGAAVEGLLPEPGRAEPDCLQRPGGELPGRRRDPGPDRPGRGRQQRRHGDLQGVRHQAHVHADHRRRHHPAEGGARSEHARLRQRDHAAGLPRFPRSSTRRAETNVELRDGQSFAIAGLLDNLTQEDAAAIPVLSQHPDHREPVQEQGRSRRTDRADGAHHAAAGARARARRSAAAADAAAPLPARAGSRRRREGRAGKSGQDRQGPDPNSRDRRTPASSTRRAVRRRAAKQEPNEPGRDTDAHARTARTSFGTGSRLRPSRHLAVRADGVQRVRARLRDDVDRAGGRRRTPPTPARWRGRSRAASTTSTIRRRRTASRPTVRSGVAEANMVWQQAGTPVVTFDCPAGVTGPCVKVESTATARMGARRSRRCSVRSSGSRRRRSRRRRRPSSAMGTRRLPAPDCVRR